MKNFVLSFLTSLTAALAMPVQAQQRPAVVELFTSEGCSSCPPAELYLGELAQRPDVLALAFHVNYWDGLGWHDRFVIPEATPRQRNYARVLRLASVYTPQMVIDGTGDFVGSDRTDVAKALQGSRSGVPLQILVQENSIAVEVGAAAPGTAADVTLIAFERSAVSPIGRGENAGRTLKEYNIVRGVTPLGSYEGSRQTYHALVSALPKDATDLAIIVQARGQQGILGAAQMSLR